MYYLFYDLETTGLCESFDQIVRFAAIKADKDLKEIERYEIDIKLRPDIVPSPYALIVTRLGINDISENTADGFVSAGNTGALMAISKFVLKTLNGINRPAIAGLMPTLKGQTVILDLGANVDCSNHNLVNDHLVGVGSIRVAST